MDRLYSEADLQWIIENKNSYDKVRLAQQLLDTMRENERLRALLKRVTEDTEYSCMPSDLQDDIELAIGSKESDDKS